MCSNSWRVVNPPLNLKPMTENDIEYNTWRQDALNLTYIGKEILKTYKPKRIDERTVVLIKDKKRRTRL